METKFAPCFVILILVLFLAHRALFAEEAPLAYRESIILTTLNTLEYIRGKQTGTRENAMLQSIREAQGKSNKGRIKKERGGSFLGRLGYRTHPYLNESVSFDDNVDSAKSNRKSSIINTVTPGLKMNFRDKKKYLALDTHINTQLYNNRRRNNTQDIQVGLTNAYNIGPYLLTILGDYFTNYFATEELGVDDNDYTECQQSGLGFTLGRHFNRIGFDAGYKRTDNYYEHAQSSDDQAGEVFTFNEYLRIATKTRLSFGYTRSRTKYAAKHSPNDSNSSDFNLNLSGVLSPKLTAMLGATYGLTDSKGGSDSRSTGLAGSLGHKISKRSSLALSFNHAIHEESAKENYSITDVFQLAVSHRLAFNPRLNFSFSSQASYASFPKKAGYTQRDDAYNLGCGLSYAFRQWLDFSLDWSQKISESNVNSRYYGNTITFKTQASF